ncbi:F-box protein CPR30-like [Hibiscus syriacus]|uniref:F-box protein CPR30-like n=1 Tax=Hibiscus syriacus TaxID=106335 RepID=A0A6A2Z7V6_HIBSY|nr:F-box protein CPR30-like [Hibiscus syriacus]
MSSKTPFPPKLQYLSLGASCIAIAISTILVLLYTILYSQKCSQSFVPFNELKWSTSTDDMKFATNISHIKFILASSQKTLKSRKPYIESWWQPNGTRGNIFLDSPPPKDFLPWPSTYPPFQVNEDVKKLRVYPKLVVPAAVRMFRSILETFWLEDDQNVLGKYDHTKYHYTGMTSEAVKSNFDFSFDMAYGGAGYALSYSLVKTLVPIIDDCIERYPYLRVSDQLLSSCLADLGVDLTHVKGFHQIDLLGDISGLLSSHPQSPLLSLHHLDGINPIFPSKNQYESINHLMKAAKFDQSRLLQQSICYHKPTNWSFTVAWGYSAHVYETVMPRSLLRKPLETFQPFKKSARPPFYMFNTRLPWVDPSCQAAHAFFLVECSKVGDQIRIKIIVWG